MCQAAAAATESERVDEAEKAALLAELEATGRREAQRKLDAGLYGRRKVPVIAEWLGRRARWVNAGLVWLGAAAALATIIGLALDISFLDE